VESIELATRGTCLAVTPSRESGPDFNLKVMLAFHTVFLTMQPCLALDQMLADAEHGRETETAMSHMEASPYVATHVYDSKLPTQRTPYMVAPSTVGDKRRDYFVLQTPTRHDFETGDFVRAEFFSQVNPNWFSHRASAKEWDYGMRREAQEVLSFLYLGPATAAKDREFLERQGITLLLSIRNKRSAAARLLSGEKVARELGIEADSIDVEDSRELIASFPRAIRRINDHLLAGTSSLQQATAPRVLVFCESGNSRSASVVVSYMMVMFNLGMEDALWTVQHRRFSIDVDDSLRYLLQSFETILAAKRDVIRAQRMMPGEQLTVNSEPISRPQGQLSRKRSYMDDDSEATTINGSEMDTDNNLPMKQAFGYKAAPFADR
jgi:serine/threonine/tyrosine-interacting protein